MGDSEKGNVDESSTEIPKPRAKVVTILILGIFAPIMIMMYNYGWSNELTIQSIFWMYNSSTWSPGFTLIPVYALFSMFPFFLLRLVPVLMIDRYYNEKTTRGRALIASTVGDGIFLVVTLPNMIISIVMGFGYLMIPLPFQMVVAILILWRSPVPEPIVPWEGLEEEKSWWEKSPETQQESPDIQQKTSPDDEDKLW